MRLSETISNEFHINWTRPWYPLWRRLSLFVVPKALKAAVWGPVNRFWAPNFLDWLAIILDPKICRQHPNNSQVQSQFNVKIRDRDVSVVSPQRPCFDLLRVYRKGGTACAAYPRDMAMWPSGRCEWLMFLGVYDVEICWTVTGREKHLKAFVREKQSVWYQGSVVNRLLMFACESVSAKHLASWMWWGLKVWWVEKVQVSWLVIFVGILGCWLNMLNSGGYTQNWHGRSARNYLDCIPDLRHENQRNVAGITIPPPAAAAFSVFPSFLTLSPGLAVQLGHSEPSCNSPGELRIVITIHFTDSPPCNKACLHQYLPAFHVWSLSNYLEVHFQLWVNLVYIIYIYYITINTVIGCYWGSIPTYGL